MKLSNKLELIRKKEKLSRAKFGKKLNKSEDAIYNLEKERTPIDIDFIDLVCNTFKIDKDWFLNGSGEIVYCTSTESLELSDVLNKIIDSDELTELVSKLTKLSKDKIKALNILVDVMHENEK